MLPEDTRARRAASAQSRQGTLDPHLQECSSTEQVIRYSDDLFQEVAIAWLVSTDQVLCAALYLSGHTDITASPSKHSSMQHSRG